MSKFKEVQGPDDISQPSTEVSRDPPLGSATAQDVEKQPPDSPQASPSSSKTSMFKSLGLLDRFLALWILLAMAIGIILGNFVPETGPTLQRGEFVGVSVPIGISTLPWLVSMIADEESRWVVGHDVSDSVQSQMHRYGTDQLTPTRNVIIVYISPRQVLIWTGLAGGDNEYCAILVAINSVLQMVLFAPLAVLFLRVISQSNTEVNVSYSIVATSVAVFLGIPLGAAIITRFALRKLASPKWYDEIFLKWLSPWSLIGLLFTILVLFASQGRQVVHQIVSVVRVAAPLIIYFGVVFFVTLLVTHKLGFGYKLAATQSFTAASNNFELAIAVAVATFGANSDQALAATVGPLIEVPVLLALVYVVKWIGKRRNWKD
ncbi:MAG: hypothetical protein Q9164_005557 [Protoblastenia rupestris]